VVLPKLGLGVLLLSHKYRVYAAYGIMLLLLAVSPANVHMLTTAMASSEPQVPIWALVVRLPIQLLFIFWAWSVRDYQPKGKIISRRIQFQFNIFFDFLFRNICTGFFEGIHRFKKIVYWDSFNIQKLQRIMQQFR
jgi:hypothetical protein